MKTVFFWHVMIAALSLYPSESSTTKGYADKVFHAGVYAITCLLFYTTFKVNHLIKPLLFKIKRNLSAANAMMTDQYNRFLWIQFV